MKTLPLFVSLAVTATAADLKDPDAVAREWNQTIEQAKEPATPPQSLKEQLTLKPAVVPARELRVYDTSAQPLRRAPGPLYDLPRNNIPDVLPDNLPPGAKPWYYNGRQYWLLPIGPDYRLIPIRSDLTK